MNLVRKYNMEDKYEAYDFKFEKELTEDLFSNKTNPNEAVASREEEKGAEDFDQLL